MPRVKAIPQRRRSKRSAGASQVQNRMYPDYRVIGLGDLVYISERGNSLRTESTYLANKKLMEAIIVEKKTPLTVEVARLSKTQLGNVVKAIKMIDAANVNVDVEITQAEENGNPLLIAQMK